MSPGGGERTDGDCRRLGPGARRRSATGSVASVGLGVEDGVGPAVGPVVASGRRGSAWCPVGRRCHGRLRSRLSALGRRRRRGWRRGRLGRRLRGRRGRGGVGPGSIVTVRPWGWSNGLPQLMFWKASAVHVWSPTSVPVTRIPILTRSSAEPPFSRPRAALGAQPRRSSIRSWRRPTARHWGSATIEVAPTVERPRDRGSGRTRSRHCRRRRRCW